jgi:nicotinamidase-related amidase
MSKRRKQMNTQYNEIVNVNSIGKTDNPISLNEILRLANNEKLTPAHQNNEKVLFLAIDVQQDFMDNGALGVPGAHGDVERMTHFIYDNMDKITNIAVSIDTHTPHQIFHPCWWIDEDGNNPGPATPITLADLDSGKWRAVINPAKSRDYVEHLEKDGKKTLVVWPYHCIQGTTGCALENQFANMVYFHSVAKKTVVQRLVKGQDPLSEMYGIIKPEYDTKNYINLDFLNKMESYDKIVICGEARDFCVYESLKQMLAHYANNTEVLKKVYVLEDCMSAIGAPADVDKMYADLQSQYKFNIVKSTEWSL